ncbi:MAG TPA: response regulator [Candidatus Wallbacteria bacterium]|nr:response regulator [Candidatus Wallbacteria bacterium]
MIKFDEPCNILLVDDSSTARIFLKKTFEKAGFTNKNFIMASDGQQALEKLPSENIDLIVTDLIMPNIDGHELIKRIKSMPEHSYIPVIVTTSSSNRAKEEELLEAGAEMVLPKPIEAEALCEAWKRARYKMRFKNETIRAFKTAFCDVLNAMTSITLNDIVLGAKIDDSFFEDSLQYAISTLKPPGFKFIITMKRPLLRKITSIICDLKSDEITGENEKETLAELLNASAGAFVKQVTSSDQVFELNLPVEANYPLNDPEVSNCAFKLKENI